MKKIILWALIACLGLFALSAQAGDEKKSEANAAAAAGAGDTRPKGDRSLLKTDNDKLNYIFGYQTVSQIKSMGVQGNPAVFSQAMQDAMDGKAPAISQEEAMVAMKSMKAALEKEADETLKKGEAFLAANKGKEGIKVTTSGLQYKVIKPGAGPNAKDGEIAKVNYRGSLIDGKQFIDSSKGDTPGEFPVGPEISAGWGEALKLMNKGAKYEVYLPSNLAGRFADIPRNSVVIFDIELLDLKPAPAGSMGGKMGGMGGMEAMHGGSMPGHSSMPGHPSMPSGHPAMPSGHPAMQKAGAIGPQSTPGAGCPMK